MAATIFGSPHTADGLAVDRPRERAALLATHHPHHQRSACAVDQTVNL